MSGVVTPKFPPSWEAWGDTCCCEKIMSDRQICCDNGDMWFISEYGVVGRLAHGAQEIEEAGFISSPYSGHYCVDDYFILRTGSGTFVWHNGHKIHESPMNDLFPTNTPGGGKGYLCIYSSTERILYVFYDGDLVFETSGWNRYGFSTPNGYSGPTGLNDYVVVAYSSASGYYRLTVLFKGEKIVNDIYARGVIGNTSGSYLTLNYAQSDVSVHDSAWIDGEIISESSSPLPQLSECRNEYLYIISDLQKTNVTAYECTGTHTVYYKGRKAHERQNVLMAHYGVIKGTYCNKYMSWRATLTNGTVNTSVIFYDGHMLNSSKFGKDFYILEYSDSSSSFCDSNYVSVVENNYSSPYYNPHHLLYQGNVVFSSSTSNGYYRSWGFAAVDYVFIPQIGGGGSTKYGIVFYKGEELFRNNCFEFESCGNSLIIIPAEPSTGTELPGGRIVVIDGEIVFAGNVYLEGVSTCECDYATIHESSYGLSEKRLVWYKGNKIYDGSTGISRLIAVCCRYFVFFPDDNSTVFLLDGEQVDYEQERQIQCYCCSTDRIYSSDSAAKTIDIWDADYGKMKFDLNTFERLDSVI